MKWPGPASIGTAAAVVLALATPDAWSFALADRVTRDARRVDERIAVVAFDERAAETTFLDSIPHRQGGNLSQIAGEVGRGGGTGIIFVGFDGLALGGGPDDRALISKTEQIQTLGIAPLLDVRLEEGSDGIPVAVRYRVDELAADFAGLGIPLVAADGTVVRSVPAIASLTTLEPGALVRSRQNAQDASIVFGLAARATAPTSAQSVSADQIDLPSGTVPLEQGSLRIRWSSQLNSDDDPAVVPAGRVLGVAGPVSSAVPPDTWAGKIVLVGTIDPAHTVYYDTPIGPMPELFVQANALNTLLTGDYLRPVPAGVSLVAVLVLAVGVGALWVRRPRWATAAGLGAAITWAMLAAALASNGWLVDPFRPALAAVLTVLALGGTALVRQLIERRRLARLFSEYVPPDVARDLVGSGRARVAEAGERLLVTVLFCDLRGFTPIAARLAPSDVRLLLDRYYETFSQIVFDHGGTVLQYTGDEIFAAFGAPVPRTDHADAALACARVMHAALPDHNEAQAAGGLPEIAFGIGLHSGLVVAAHVGSSIRRQYSIIGDTVNVGSRLCSQAREHQTVYSQALSDQLTARPATLPDGDVQLKGVRNPMTIYRISADESRASERGEVLLARPGQSSTSGQHANRPGGP